MRARKFWMIVASACTPFAMAAMSGAQGPVRVQVPHGRLVITQRGAATVIAYIEHGVRYRAVLPVEATIHPRALDSAQLVGVVPGRVFVLSISYASRPNGGIHQCGAGTETIVRVIKFARTSYQTFAQTIESCWLPIDEGSADWDPSKRMLTIAKTNFSEDPPVSSTVKYLVGEDGSIHAQETTPQVGLAAQE